MELNTSKIIKSTECGDCNIFTEFIDDSHTPNELTDYQMKKTDVNVIELDLGTKCNLDCPLCHRNWVDAQHLLSDNIMRPGKEIIAQLEEYPNLHTITLAGVISEPTLHKDFFELVEYIVSRNILFYIYTNANTHNPKWWTKLGSLVGKKTLVYFTICGSTQEMHEKYRVGSSLQQILDNHEAFISTMKYKNDVFQYLFFEYNRNDYDNTKYIRDTFSRESSIESMPYKERFDLINDVDIGMHMKEELSKKYKAISAISKKRYKTKKCNMDCPSRRNKFISIDNKGDVFPCYMFRLYNYQEKWDMNHEKILNAEYDFCYECEQFTVDIIKSQDGLLRIVEC